jgi:hypothetical protein
MPLAPMVCWSSDARILPRATCRWVLSCSKIRQIFGVGGGFGSSCTQCFSPDNRGDLSSKKLDLTSTCLRASQQAAAVVAECTSSIHSLAHSVCCSTLKEATGSTSRGGLRGGSLQLLGLPLL